jgi:hypothetical protein
MATRKPDSATIDRVRELLRLGGLDLAPDQIQTAFASSGYPHVSTSSEIKQAWMRGRLKKRAVPKPFSALSHRALPKIVIPMPRTVRARPVVAEQPPTELNRCESRTARYNRLRRWRERNGYRTGRGMTFGFREWAVCKFIHECLCGPDANIKSCLDPSIMVQYEAKFYMARAKAKAMGARAKEQYA